MSWSSPPLATYRAMASELDERYGTPVERDLDSNGAGLFDLYHHRFACGLEVALWRFHLGAQFRTIDPRTEPSIVEVHANARGIEHIAFHLGVPIAALDLWSDASGPLLAHETTSVIVMRTDDNGNDVEVARATSRCEADAIARAFEARGHKQLYWLRSR